MDERVELRIDIFEKRAQVARVLRSLTVGELIAEVLDEFDELEYLDRAAPGKYVLRRKEDPSPLDASLTLAELHLSPGTELSLEETPVILPSGAEPMPGDVYLVLRRQSDVDEPRAFKLNWQPAVVGRPDTLLPQNELLAVNLELFPSGLRVSRRQAQITAGDGHYYLESLSNNPMLINEETEPVSGVRELREGDLIHLVRSDLTLKFIARPRWGLDG